MRSPVVEPDAMNTLSSREAAERIGISVASFHRLARKHTVSPIIEAPGVRGAKFWLRTDIDKLTAIASRERGDAA